MVRDVLMMNADTAGLTGSPAEYKIRGVAYDTPVPGYFVNCDVTLLLRLWKSETVESFDFQKFNTGDYYRAVEEKVKSETISGRCCIQMISRK